MKQDDAVFGAAIEGLAGAALVLDERRRVRLATPAAVQLLRRKIPHGVLVT
ncbi:hypothetical protein G6O45_23855, partial [Salmonella enterica subsp. enterica serovar Istanbul]|nr:hypothetical protein [Salmonella enterica subsp. enterica serovar Istanbul]